MLEPLMTSLELKIIPKKKQIQIKKIYIWRSIEIRPSARTLRTSSTEPFSCVLS